MRDPRRAASAAAQHDPLPRRAHRPGGKPQVVAQRQRARPACAAGSGTGRSAARPRRPGVYVVQVRGARPRRQRRPHAVGGPARRRATRRRPGGITVRSLAVQPPLRPVTAGKKADVLRRLAPPRRTAGTSAGSAPSARCGAARWPPRGRRPLQRARPRGQLRAVPARAAVRPLRDARCRSSCRPPSRADVLVVVPAITWLGTDPVDDPPVLDGIPDLLDPARRPRALAARVRGRGRAARGPRRRRRAAADVPRPRRHPLRPHERPRPRALQLSARERPQGRAAGGQPSAGSRARWRGGCAATRSTAAGSRPSAPRRCAAASRCAPTTRRASGELLRPTQPTDAGPVRRQARAGAHARTRPQPIAAARRRPRATGCSTGFDGTLDGFSAFEESDAARGGRPRAACWPRSASRRRSPSPSAGRRAAARARYALTATKLGDGLVIRVGLPQWAQRLRRPEVSQVTRNIDRPAARRKPKIRSTPSVALGAQAPALDAERLHPLPQRPVLLVRRSRPARRRVGGKRERRARRPRRRAARAARAPRGGRRGRAAYQISASGWWASSARASGYCSAVKATSARGAPASFSRRAWVAAMPSRTRPGSCAASSRRGAGSTATTPGAPQEVLDPLALRAVPRRRGQQQHAQRRARTAPASRRITAAARRGCTPTLVSASPSPRPGTASRGRGARRGARRGRGARARRARGARR